MDHLTAFPKWPGYFIYDFVRTLYTFFRNFPRLDPGISPYRPLDEDEIRIAFIYRNPLSPDQISCTIEHVKLSAPQRPFYKAISYTWGSDERDHSITWITRTIQVTKSCYDACKEYADHGETGQTIWIDQLCIDQDNLDERGRQVEMMAEIYRQAAEVSIWLGDPDSEVLGMYTESCLRPAEDMAEISFLEKVQNVQDAGKMLSGGTAWSVTRRVWNRLSVGDVLIFKGLLLCVGLTRFITNVADERRRGEIDDLRKLVQDEAAWRGLMGIFKRTNTKSAFYRRTWIIQEACATANSWCYISQFRVPFPATLSAMLAISRLPYGDTRFLPLFEMAAPHAMELFLGKLETEVRLTRAMRTVSERFLLHPSSLKLSFLLDICAEAEFHDDRDTFYALRSLVSRDNRKPPLVNYHASI